MLLVSPADTASDKKAIATVEMDLRGIAGRTVKLVIGRFSLENVVSSQARNRSPDSRPAGMEAVFPLSQ
jgi:hypothetical protein